MKWPVTALVLSAASMPITAHPCDILHAQYVAAAEPGLHLRFVKMASSEGVVSDVGLHIYSNDPKAEIWYYPDEGSILRVSLISTTDFTKSGWHVEPDGGIRPHGWATLITMASDGRIAPLALKSASMPPHYVIIPELAQVYRQTVRYRPGAFVLRSCVK